MEHITVCIHDCNYSCKVYNIRLQYYSYREHFHTYRCDGFVHHLAHDLAAFHALVSVSHTDGSDTTTSGGSVCS